MIFGKKILVLVLSLAIYGSLVSPVQAANLVVNCPNSTADGDSKDTAARCTFSDGQTVSTQPLFQENNLAPGETLIQTITINNQDQNETCNLQMTIEDQAVDLLSQVLNTAIYSGAVNYQGSHTAGVANADTQLADLFGTSFSLGSIPVTDAKIFNWLLSLDGASVGNDYQGLTADFAFAISFVCGEPSQADGTTTFTLTEGAGGEGSTGKVSAPKCEYPDLFPSAPGNVTVTATGDNSVTVSWDAVTESAETETHYAIFFNDGAGSEHSVLHDYVGAATSYSITQIPGGSWNFSVVAWGGNDYLCAGPAGTDNVVLTGGATEGPIGEEGEVLGETTDVSPTPILEPTESSGQVGGVTDVCPIWSNYIPWILLLIQALIILLADYLLREDKGKRKQFLAVLTTAVIILVFYLIRDCQCYSLETILAWLCRWFWLASLLELVVLQLVNYGFIEVAESSKT